MAAKRTRKKKVAAKKEAAEGEGVPEPEAAPAPKGDLVAQALAGEIGPKEFERLFAAIRIARAGGMI